MNIWTTLGLKSTDDVSEIRRAYARELKAIDVEADPAAFIALRTAFDQALQQAERRRRDMPMLPPIEFKSGSGFAPVSPLFGPTPLGLRLEPAAPPPEQAPPAPAAPVPAPAPGDPAPPPEAASPPAPPAAPPAPAARPAAPEPEPEPAPRDDGARFIALEDLLFGGGEGGGDEIPDPAELEAAVRAILDHPEMHRVEASADIEYWLASTLYETLPRGDSVLPLVVDHFHWEKHIGRLNNPWIFEELVKRRAAFVFVAQVTRPDHNLHRAWLDLTSEKEKLGFGARWIAADVRILLETIRRDYPMAEHYLSPHRVGSWETRFYADGSGGGGYVGNNFGWGAFAVIGLIALVRLMSAASHPSPNTAPIVSYQAPPPYVAPPEPATTPQADMDATIGAFTFQRYSLATLQLRNPALHGRLMARWNTQRAYPRSLAEFQDEITTILGTAERDAFRAGSYQLQSAWWRLERDKLAWLQGRDVAACARLARGERPAITLPIELNNRRNQLRIQAIGEPLPLRVPPAAGARRFSIPGAAVEIAIRRSGLSDARLARSWLNRGPDSDRCAAGIALIDAALALPARQGRQLLRDMSAGL